MFNIARKLATKSEHKQHHHACIITKGGKIIATGYNHRYLHAEEDAIRKLVTRWIRTGREQTGLVLWSFRWRKNGTWGNAMPCNRCREALSTWSQGYQFAAVRFTNTKGELQRL